MSPLWYLSTGNPLPEMLFHFTRPPLLVLLLPHSLLLLSLWLVPPHPPALCTLGMSQSLVLGQSLYFHSLRDLFQSLSLNNIRIQMAPKSAPPACTSLLILSYSQPPTQHLYMICHKHLRLDKVKTKLPISPLRSAPLANSQLIKTIWSHA